MKVIDILLLLLVFFIFYLLNPKKKIQRNKKNKLDNSYLNSEYLDGLVNEIEEWDKKNGYSIVEKKKINPNFIDVQFNTHYRDVITAFNNLVPAQKQLFNLANQPIKYNELDPKNVYGMVTDFIKSINKNISQEVPNERHNNTGWDEAVSNPNHISGWEKIQIHLGLAPSLYPTPSSPGKVLLVKIDKVQKYETEDEIKYSCHIIIIKENVKDQMIVKVEFVQDKNSIHDENDFFKDHELVMKVAIESISIVGYLSEKGTDSTKQYNMVKEKYYDIDRMEYNNLTDPKYIMSELTKRHNKKQREMDYRNALLDEDGQDFHKTLPHAYDYSTYQSTRTIYDHIKKQKQFN